MDVAAAIAGATIVDRGIADIETGARRTVVMTADGRSAFDYDRAKAASWLRSRWPQLSAEHVTAALDMLHDCVVARAHKRASEGAARSKSAWASWPLRPEF
ncbi:hypothetical protein [Paraburkholderia susongensis]|uniref:hypothetical protein n=1 Tax=Paraburkholderia susongensis TaxID=1515439 RepID=UPI000A1CA503|nr:hypothetical protein [Paraburkholderia susongensis]